ncbi:glycosyltransferase [Pedobacter changchengzhani]|uniref:Glycosyltransferase n=1 Tax=Pedobacter changchengzhani TaxID=2529274 RepID=A0A4R5MQ02_9SPHI|nr:glycosyltransferase family 4 protein [Pedobacter changchengzhani]TDG37716.1 glycosyltransferase [Pedobacter changchengzhani]
MSVHTIFVEPANYTEDLINNVYKKQNIKYSFLHSTSVATNNTIIIDSAEYIFDRNNLFSNVSFLWRCINENNLIIINGYNHLAFIFLWIFSLFVPCYVGIESDTPYYPTKSFKRLLKTIYLKFIFSNKKILGLPGGTGLHTQLFLHYGMNKDRIFLLPMMVDNARFKRAIKDENLLHQPLNFIFVGRLVEEKNPVLLVKAFINVLNKGLNAVLTIIGAGECYGELVQLSAKFSNIRILGKKFGNDLLAEYQGANVLVLPSNFEPWGLVVNEAMASGLPVLCSSVVGAAHDLVEQPDSGWVFKANDEADLTEKLIQIINNPLAIIDKAKRGQDFILNYWNYNLYTERLNKILTYAQRS